LAVAFTALDAGAFIKDAGAKRGECGERFDR
jgi:hypothetical protein